jgi:hypothetical protein
MTATREINDFDIVELTEAAFEAPAAGSWKRALTDLR